METSSCSPSHESRGAKLRGDKFKLKEKRYFIKDFLANLHISLPQGRAEAWRFEGLTPNVWMLFC